MSVNSELIKLMRELNLECEENEYTGSKDEYVIFDYEDEIPALIADNRTEYDEVYIQLKLITPKKFNYLDLKNSIKNKLEENDWFISGCNSFLGDIYTETTKLRTTVFNIHKAVYRNKED